MKFLFLLLLSTLLSNNSKEQPAIQALLERSALPEGFLKNAGQVIDLENRPVDFVYYQANLGNEQVYITKYGISILFAKAKNITRFVNGLPQKGSLLHNATPSDSICVANYELERVDISLKNASILEKNIITTTDERSPKYNFYFTTAQSQEQQLLNTVLIKNVYPGIDWKIYVNKENNKTQGFKYDFIIHPGADISKIKLHYSDNAVIELADNESAKGASGTLAPLAIRAT